MIVELVQLKTVFKYVPKYSKLYLFFLFDLTVLCNRVVKASKPILIHIMQFSVKVINIFS